MGNFSFALVGVFLLLVVGNVMSQQSLSIPASNGIDIGLLNTITGGNIITQVGSAGSTISVSLSITAPADLASLVSVGYAIGDNGEYIIQTAVANNTNGSGSGSGNGDGDASSSGSQLRSSALLGASMVAAATQAERNPALAGLIAATGILASIPTVSADDTSSFNVDITITIPSSLTLNSLYLSTKNGQTIVARGHKITYLTCGFNTIANWNIFPNEAPTCPYCCSGNGQCTTNGCICNNGYDGLGCELTQPSYVVNTTGLPLNGKRLATWVRGNLRWLWVQPVVDASGLYYTSASNPKIWTLYQDDSANLVIITEDNRILYGSQLLYFINETDLSRIRVDNHNGAPSAGFGRLVGNPSYVVGQSGNFSQPQFYIYNISADVWINTNFPFLLKDINAYETRLVIGQDNSVYYASYLGGAYMLASPTATWVEVTNQPAPFWFNADATNFRTVEPRTQWSSSAQVPSSDAWTSIRAGLPPIYWVEGITFCSGFLYMSISQSMFDGIYQFDGQSWYFIAVPANEFGTGPLFCLFGNVYANDHGGLARLSLGTSNEGGDGKTYWVDTGAFIYDIQNFNVFQGTNCLYLFFQDQKSNVYIKNFTANPTNPSIGNTVWITSFPFSATWPGIGPYLFEGVDGGLWYVTRNEGIYLLENSVWSLVSNQSGYITVGADGSVYLSYEITPISEVSTFFLYQPGQNPLWKQVHISQGFSIQGYQFDSDGTVVFIGDWAPEFLIKGTRKWNLPQLSTGFNLQGDDYLSQALVYPTIANGVIYGDLEFSHNGRYERRFVAIQPQLGDEYYDSNMDLTTGTYLTTAPNNGTGVAVKILSNGNILVALDTAQTTFGGISVTGASSTLLGRILVLNSDATSVLYALVVGSSVIDVAAYSDSSDYAIIATYEGVAKISLTTGQAVWSYNHSSTTKSVSVSGSYVAAMLDNLLVFVFDESTGNILWNVTLSGRSFTTDVVVSSADSVVIVVGFDNKKLPSGEPVQVAFLLTYSATNGGFIYSRFAFNSADLSDNIADTRLYQANLGRDGALYLLGDTAGSETIFRYNGTAYDGDVIVQTVDFYNGLWDTQGAAISYQARFDISTGTIEGASLTMARLPNGLSNTFLVADIAGDTYGNTFIAGISAAYYGNRPATTVNGVPPGEYHGDPCLLWIRPSYNARRNWNSLIRDKPGAPAGSANNGGQSVGVDADGTKGVILINIAAGGEGATTNNAMIATNQNTVIPGVTNPAVYLAVFPTPDNQ